MKTNLNKNNDITMNNGLPSSSKTSSINNILSLPITMSTPPTIKLGVANAPSLITNSTLISSTLPYPSTVLNPIFTYPFGDIRRTDYDGVYHDTYYPNYLFVSNKAITGQFGLAGNLTVEFIFYGLKFEVSENGTGQTLRMLVDEGQGFQYVSETFLTDSVGDGNGYLRLVTFSTLKLRKIRLQYDQNVKFGGIRIGANDAIMPISRQLGKSAIFLGDSYTEGVASPSTYQGYGGIASSLLGWEYWSSGLGATGYLATGNGLRLNFRQRIQHDVIQYKPDYCVIAGGINDTALYTAAQVQTEAGLLYDAIIQGSPNTKIIVLSGWMPRDVSNSIGDISLQIDDALKTEAQKRSLPFIDVIRGYTYDGKGNILTNGIGAWITGEGGYIGNGESFGNASVFISADSTHPTTDGHRYLGEMLAREIIKILNN